MIVFDSMKGPTHCVRVRMDDDVINGGNTCDTQEKVDLQFQISFFGTWSKGIGADS